MSLPKVGIDIVEVSRFTNVLKKKQTSFLRRVFSEHELTYCETYKDMAVHLAGLFAAKESVSKALGVTKYPFSEIEIRHTQVGAPHAYHHGKKLPISISISHTSTLATAVAVG
jgi:phosphopantetheine--protein transferase-like protein